MERKTKLTSTFFSCFLMIIFMMAIQAKTAHSSSYSDSDGPLKYGYYKDSCPLAAELVRSVVQKAILAEPRMAASLIRLQFHDCFVRGCDASVLLDSTWGYPSEKESIANKDSLRGFEVIDEAKALVESYCEATVSCADILVLAARDANYYTGGERYEVPCGRLDGRVSTESEATANLPAPTFTVDELKKAFAAKGLDAEDLVVLSGAHTIGRSHCRVFSSRLYNYSWSAQQDPSIGAGFAETLKWLCPNTESGGNSLVFNDYQTPDIYDNAYYKNIQSHDVLFTSDQTLLDDQETSDLVDEYAENQDEWINDFSDSMVKMSTIGVLTGEEGEIRKYCRVINY